MSDQARQTLSTVETHSREIHVTWGDGHISRFHHLWLRDNCRCPDCLHPQTRERIHDTYAIDPDIAPESVAVLDDGATLALTWPDGHQTDLPGAWLRHRCYSEAARAERHEELKLWGSDILSALPEVEAASALNTDEGLQDFIQKIRDYGLAVVRNLDCHDGMVEILAGRISYLRQTNYGVITSGFSRAHRSLGAVMNPPGQIAFTVIPCSAQSAAVVRVS